MKTIEKDKDMIEFARFICENVSFDVENDSFYTNEDIKDFRLSRKLKNKISKIRCFDNINNELFYDVGIYKVDNDLIGIPIDDFINIAVIGYGNIDEYYRDYIFNAFINFPFIGKNGENIEKYKSDLSWVIKIKNIKNIKRNLEWLKDELEYWHREAGRGFAQRWEKFSIEYMIVMEAAYNNYRQICENNLTEKAKILLQDFIKTIDLEVFREDYPVDFIIDLIKSNKRNNDELIIYNEKTNKFEIDYERISFLAEKLKGYN